MNYSLEEILMIVIVVLCGATLIFLIGFGYKRRSSLPSKQGSSQIHQETLPTQLQTSKEQCQKIIIESGEAGLSKANFVDLKINNPSNSIQDLNNNENNKCCIIEDGISKLIISGEKQQVIQQNYQKLQDESQLSVQDDSNQEEFDLKQSYYSVIPNNVQPYLEGKQNYKSLQIVPKNKVYELDVDQVENQTWQNNYSGNYISGYTQMQESKNSLSDTEDLQNIDQQQLDQDQNNSVIIISRCKSIQQSDSNTILSDLNNQIAPQQYPDQLQKNNECPFIASSSFLKEQEIDDSLIEKEFLNQDQLPTTSNTQQILLIKKKKKFESLQQSRISCNQAILGQEDISEKDQQSMEVIPIADKEIFLVSFHKSIEADQNEKIIEKNSLLQISQHFENKEYIQGIQNPTIEEGVQNQDRQEFKDESVKIVVNLTEQLYKSRVQETKNDQDDIQTPQNLIEKEKSSSSTEISMFSHEIKVSTFNGYIAIKLEVPHYTHMIMKQNEIFYGTFENTDNFLCFQNHGWHYKVSYDENWNPQFQIYEGNFLDNERDGEGILFQGKSQKIGYNGWWKQSQQIEKPTKPTIEYYSNQEVCRKIIIMEQGKDEILNNNAVIKWNFEQTYIMYNQQISEKDMRILKSKNEWFTSSIIDAFSLFLNIQDEKFYFSKDKVKQKEHDRVLFIPSYVYTSMHQGEVEENKRIYQSHLLEFMPINYQIWRVFKKVCFIINHSNNHWFLIQLDFNKMVINVFDSILNGSEYYEKTLTIINGIFDNIFSFNEPALKNKQDNNYDCGPSTCLNMLDQLSFQIGIDLKTPIYMRAYLLELLKNRNKLIE